MKEKISKLRKCKILKHSYFIEIEEMIDLTNKGGYCFEYFMTNIYIGINFRHTFIKEISLGKVAMRI